MQQYTVHLDKNLYEYYEFMGIIVKMHKWLHEQSWDNWLFNGASHSFIFYNESHYNLFLLKWM